MVHADARHHGLAAQIGHRGPGQDLGQPERPERPPEALSCRLGGIALAPGAAHEPPADLDRWVREVRERHVEARDREADEADETLGVVDGEEPEAVLVPAPQHAVEPVVAGRPVHHRREELHDLGVGVHGRVRRPVVLRPRPQEQPGGAQLGARPDHEARCSSAPSGSAIKGAKASSAAPSSGESDPSSATESRTTSPGACSVTDATPA